MAAAVRLPARDRTVAKARGICCFICRQSSKAIVDDTACDYNRIVAGDRSEAIVDDIACDNNIRVAGDRWARNQFAACPF